MTTEQYLGCNAIVILGIIALIDVNTAAITSTGGFRDFEVK